MAGGKIFLEPILQNTVVEPINGIVQNLNVIPEQILLQIEALKDLSAIVSASATAINVIPGEAYKKTLADSFPLINGGFTARTVLIKKFYATNTANGRVKLIYPELTYSFYNYSSSSQRDFSNRLFLNITDNTAAQVLAEVSISNVIVPTHSTIPYTCPSGELEFNLVAGHEYSFNYRIVAANNDTIANSAQAEGTEAILGYDFNNPMIDGPFVI